MTACTFIRQSYGATFQADSQQSPNLLFSTPWIITSPSSSSPIAGVLLLPHWPRAAFADRTKLWALPHPSPRLAFPAILRPHCRRLHPLLPRRRCVAALLLLIATSTGRILHWRLALPHACRRLLRPRLLLRRTLRRLAIRPLLRHKIHSLASSPSPALSFK